MNKPHQLLSIVRALERMRQTCNAMSDHSIRLIQLSIMCVCFSDLASVEHEIMKTLRRITSYLSSVALKLKTVYLYYQKIR